MKIPSLILTLAISATSLSHATFVLVDDMESGNNWGTGSQGTIVADPADGSNNVYKMNTSPTVGGNVTAAFHSFDAITNSTTGTLFFRIRSDAANPNFIWGSSDVASPTVTGNFTGFANYEGYGRLKGAGYGFQLHNGGTFTSDLDTGAADTWYNVWLVLDNTTDVTTLYITTGTDAATTSVGSGAFRNGTTASLVTLLLANDHDGGNDYIDDIYIDTTNLNLANPLASIPEASTYAMLTGIAALLGVLARRRQS